MTDVRHSQEFDSSDERLGVSNRGAKRPSISRQRAPHPVLSVLKWGGAAFVAIVILVIVFFDWNMLRGPISHYASYRLHRQVRIEGNLHVRLWSWTPTRAAERVARRPH